MARSSTTRLVKAGASIGTSSIRLTPGSTDGPNAMATSRARACRPTNSTSKRSRLWQNSHCTGRNHAFHATGLSPNHAIAGAK